MRFSSTFLRTFYLFTNFSTRPIARYGTIQQRFVVKSMPSFPFLGSLFSSSSSSKNMSYPLQKSDDEWQAVLSKGKISFRHLAPVLIRPYPFHQNLQSKEQFRVLREKGTEAPFAGEYDKHHPETGVYTCAGCDAPLYKATHKFKSGCGWPAYFDSIPGAVTRHTDSTLGMQRTEIVCSNCGGHLGKSQNSFLIQG